MKEDFQNPNDQLDTQKALPTNVLKFSPKSWSLSAEVLKMITRKKNSEQKKCSKRFSEIVEFKHHNHAVKKLKLLQLKRPETCRSKSVKKKI